MAERQYGQPCPGDGCPVADPETHCHLPEQQRSPNNLVIEPGVKALASLVLESLDGRVDPETEFNVELEYDLEQLSLGQTVVDGARQ